MKTRNILGFVMLVPLMAAVLWAQEKPADSAKPAPSAPAAAAAPATKPAVAATQAVITPQAQAEISNMKDAYAKLTSLDLAGTLKANMDVAGQKQNKTSDFTSSYEAPNKFRQEVKDDVLAGSTGEKLYLYSKDHNIYLTQDAPKGKVAPGEMPEPYNQLLGTQNPSLMLALSSDPAKSLTKTFPAAEQLANVKVDGKDFLSLKFTDPDTGGTVTMLVDPQTHLMKRATLDMSQALLKRGAPDVKAAEVTIDYSSVAPGAKNKPEQFAWTPPAGAKDAAKEAQGGDNPSDALVGKPAPDFKLKGLDDKEVALSAQKGNVVIVDFWATWCGPCVQGLPHVDKIYQDFKDKGVKAFAVNVQEPKDKVKDFITEHKLTLTALLDSDNKVAESYNVTGIPQTVVIGKDGVVKKVFVGTGPDSEAKLREAVEAAVNGS